MAIPSGAETFLLDAVFSGLLEELGVVPTWDLLSRYAREFRKHSITYPGKKSYTDGLLSAIRDSGYKLGLVSNTEALLTAYDLQSLNLAGEFEAILLSSNTCADFDLLAILEALRNMGFGSPRRQKAQN